MIEVVALAGALADAGEHRGAAMALGDVVDQLLDQHGLADAGAAEQADLAALGVGGEEVDDLDAGDQDGGFRSTGRRTAGLRRGSGRDMSLPIGPRSSIGSPMTFMMRPSVLGPTGTRICEPVAVTRWPRVRPSVASMAMVRTIFSPRCWATSSTRRLPLLSVSSAARIGGSSPSNDDVDDRADDLRDLADQSCRSGGRRRGRRALGRGLLGAGLGGSGGSHGLSLPLTVR